MLKTIDKYLIREISIACLSVTGVLMVILITTRFALFLGEAAAGRLPQEVVITLLGISAIFYLVVIIPPAFFLGILLALGRLYRDSEMAALAACGFGTLRLYRPLLTLGVFLVTITAVLSLKISPLADQFMQDLKHNARHQVTLGLAEPGQFRALDGGDSVLYTERVTQQGTQLEGVFFYHQPDEVESTLVTANSGRQRINPTTQQRTLVLENGRQYAGQPGKANYKIAEFEEFGLYLAAPASAERKQRLASRPTNALINSTNLEEQAELQRRIAAPLSVLILILLAAPLGRVSPRQGRYAKLLWGALAYLVYFLVMGVAQTGMQNGVWPAALGLWPVHFAMLLWVLVLLWRERAWRRAK